MQHITYFTKGTCASQIDFDLDDEQKIHNVKFKGGCNGNLKAIGKLTEGKDAEETATILIGNTCGNKNTSCADQFAKALYDALKTRR